MSGTATPARDLTRLDAMVTWLEANPAVHNQKTWAMSDTDAPDVTIPGDGEICGTACCLAGWTLLHDHKHYRFDQRRQLVIHILTSMPVKYSDDFTLRARDLLALTDLEALMLFAQTNTLLQIRRMTTDLQAGVDITALDYDPAAVTA